MSSTRSARLYPVLVLTSLFLAGCGGSDESLAPVKGTVTLDGKPLVGAKVEFELDTGTVAYGKDLGSTSYGKTDASGRYELKYTYEKDGAPVGKHVVRISTRDTTIDAEGNEVPVPERLPPKFNLNSELTAEVKPGPNTIDFPLKLESPPAGGE